MSDYRISGRKSEWISVKDRFPDDGRKVLVADAEKEKVGVGSYSDVFGWWVNDWAYSGASVTHWMPLPEPPEEEQ